MEWQSPDDRHRRKTINILKVGVNEQLGEDFPGPATLSKDV